MNDTVRIGRVESSSIQYGWFKLGGPPYFKRPRLEEIIEIRKTLLEKRITSDVAPAYGKGLAEMYMWMGASYLEDWWLQNKFDTRRQDDVIFTKCGIFWPRESKQDTHFDMVFFPPGAKNAADIERAVLEEYERSCTRMSVDFIHGYMLHHALWRPETSERFKTEYANARSAAARLACMDILHQGTELDLMLDGVVPALVTLFAAHKIGAIGFSNIQNAHIMARLNERVIQEGRKRGVPDCQVHFLQNEASMLGTHYSLPEGGSITSGELADYCRNNGIVRLGYSALGHGAPISDPGDFVFVRELLLAEDVQRRIHAFNIKKHDELKKLAQEYSSTPHQLALAWCLAREVVPIFSSGSVSNILDNLKAASRVETLSKSGVDRELDTFADSYRNALEHIVAGRPFISGAGGLTPAI